MTRSQRPADAMLPFLVEELISQLLGVLQPRRGATCCRGAWELPLRQEPLCSRWQSPPGHPAPGDWRECAPKGPAWATVKGQWSFRASHRRPAPQPNFSVGLGPSLFSPPPRPRTPRALPKTLLHPNCYLRVCLLRSPTCSTPSGMRHTHDGPTLPHLIICSLA